MSWRIALTCLAAGLLVACAPDLDAAPALVADTSQVLMAKAYRFDPVAIRVPVGTTVTWTNDDNFTHDVRVQGNAGWHSQPVRPGESVSHVFAQAGTYAYECAFHPQNMKGTVEVVAR
jgi:plastocyanin